MTGDLEFWLRYVGGVAVVTIQEHGEGRLLAADTLSKLIELERGRVVVELPARGLCRSHVIGKLILIHRRVVIAHGPHLRLCCPDGQVRAELRLTKVDRLIPTFETLADANRDF